jgi:hypothetical protein
MLPSVRITRQDGNTGVVAPSLSGVLAIIAFSALGVANQCATFTRPTDAFGAKGVGPLVECGAYYMQNAGKPVLLITPTCTTTGAYGAVTFTGTGTSVVTGDATVKPFDDYDAVVQVVAGGTIGVTGITYRYSLDGGVTWSPITALATATTVTLNVPVLNTSSGVKFDLAAGTLVAGDQWTCSTTRPQMTNGDLVTALEALRTTNLPWDEVLVDGDATATTIATLDAWLAGLEPTGVYKFGRVNSRHKTLPAPTGESEATFATAMATAYNGSASIRVDVAADYGDLLGSPLTGLVQRRPNQLALATRAMSFSVGVDPAEVKNGPLPQWRLTDSSGNPKWHDENYFPGLDDLRLSTLRTIPGKIGVYVTNARVLSSPGSDYVYDQHARCMNVACAQAFALLTDELSSGVRKQDPDPNTGLIYILEDDAAAIEEHVNPQIEQTLLGDVDDVAVQLARNDDISSNDGATIHAEVDVESLAYIKNFAGVAKFVKSITRTRTVAVQIGG